MEFYLNKSRLLATVKIETLYDWLYFLQNSTKTYVIQEYISMESGEQSDHFELDQIDIHPIQYFNLYAFQWLLLSFLFYT